MDRFVAMQVFSRVVETGSFSHAADLLDMRRASVTTTIQALEAHLNVRLLQRTTRRLNLTPEGAAYYEACIRILGDVEETENSFGTSAAGPLGKLRVDMPGLIGAKIIMPQIGEFHERYPGIQLMVGFSDKPVDLIQEGVDCVIRVGPLEDSSLIGRRIGLFPGITAASPEYLERHGRPETLDDLPMHVAVNYFSARTGRINEMKFVVDGNPVEVKMAGQVALNDAEAYLNAGVRGSGLIQTPRFMALPFLRAGLLEEVLAAWKPVPTPISVVYPHHRHLSPKTRAFVDWVAEVFSRCPLLNGATDPVLEDQYFPRSAAGSQIERNDLLPELCRIVA